MISVRMFGGLGNQLFQYFAAKHVEATTDSELIFDFTHIESPSAHRRSDIRDFDFFNTEKTKISDSYGNFKVNAFRARNLLSRKSELISRFMKIDSPGTREPKVSSHIKDFWRMEGYYQDYDYYFEHIERNPNFNWKLVRKDTELEKAEIEFNSKKVLAIHIRGGDYLKAPKIYRELDPTYYQKAIDYLCERFAVDEFILFTDDTRHAEMILASLGNYNFKVAPNLSASNSLLLLSKAAGIVSSNSTFSAWAAMISDSESHVTSPAIWFNQKDIFQPKVPKAILF